MSTVAKSFNQDLLTIGETENSSFLTISYNSKPFLINSGKCLSPFGVDKYKNIYTIKLEGAPIRYIHKIEKVIQEKVNKYIEQKRKEQPYNSNFDEPYVLRSQIKQKRYPYKSQIIVKLPQNSNKFIMDIKNKKGEYRSFSDIKPNTYMETQLYIRSLWLKENTVFYKWNCSNIVLYEE